MADQRIDVVIDPNGQPSATASNIAPRPNIANRPSNLRNIASIGIVANVGRQVYTKAIGNVGTITGNAQAQRNINRVTSVLATAGAFAVNPYLGVANLAVTVGTNAYDNYIRIRDENNKAQFYRQVRGRYTDKGRIK